MQSITNQIFKRVLISWIVFNFNNNKINKYNNKDKNYILNLNNYYNAHLVNKIQVRINI